MSEVLSKTTYDIMNKEATKKLIALLIKEIYANTFPLSQTIPIDKTEADKIKGAVIAPSVYAVYEAIQKVNHPRIKFITATSEDQTFEDAMKGVTPEELTLYLFLEANEADKIVDVYVYNSQVGDYLLIGGGKNDQPVVDLSNYWTKEELKKEDLWSKEELPQEELLKKSEANEIYATKVELEGVVADDNLIPITESEVETMYAEVKKTVPHLVDLGEEEID